MLFWVPCRADEYTAAKEKARVQAETSLSLANKLEIAKKNCPPAQPVQLWHDDVSVARQEAKKAQQLLVIWVGQPNQELVTKLHDCVHVRTSSYLGSKTPGVFVENQLGRVFYLRTENITEEGIRQVGVRPPQPASPSASRRLIVPGC